MTLWERLRAALRAFRAPEAPREREDVYCARRVRCCLPNGHAGECDEVYP